MTARLGVIAALAFALLFMGFATLTGALLALAIPLVVYLGAVIYFSPERPNLSAERRLSTDTLRPGGACQVEVTITNRGASLDELELVDELPDGLSIGEGQARQVTPLAAGASVTLRYTVRGPRGSYAFAETRAIARDHLGLFQRATLTRAPQTLTILPALLRLKPIPIRPLRTHDYTGPIPVRRGGSGTSFYALREYQPGDPLRWVNWRASTRRGAAGYEDSLIANQFEQERIADVGIILDSRGMNAITRPGAGGQPGSALFEYSVQAAAALSAAFLDEGHRVGLLVYGYAMARVFPGYGKRQRERILRALAQARTGDNYALNTLDYLPTRFFPTRSQMVIISPLHMDDLPVLVRLRALGYQVLVISPDPVAFETPAYAGQPAMDLPVRIAQIERRLLLRRLNQVGVQAIDWDVDVPLERLIHRRRLGALARPPRLNLARVL